MLSHRIKPGQKFRTEPTLQFSKLRYETGCKSSALSPAFDYTRFHTLTLKTDEIVRETIFGQQSDAALYRYSSTLSSGLRKRNRFWAVSGQLEAWDCSSITCTVQICIYRGYTSSRDPVRTCTAFFVHAGINGWKLAGFRSSPVFFAHVYISLLAEASSSPLFQENPTRPTLVFCVWSILICVGEQKRTEP